MLDVLTWSYSFLKGFRIVGEGDFHASHDGIGRIMPFCRYKLTDSTNSTMFLGGRISNVKI